MAWPPTLVQNLTDTLRPLLDDVPGVSGDVTVQCATNVPELGTGTIVVDVPPDSTAS
jgi:hypothetical protein